MATKKPLIEISSVLQADQITPKHWGFIRAKYRREYGLMKKAVKKNGQVKFGFDSQMKPVCEHTEY